MDDFLHNLRSGKLKQPDRSNRHFNDPQYKNAQRRNPMDRRKREFDSPKESPERMGAIKDLIEILNENQKRMAQAYEARTRIEERKARAMEILAKNLYRMLNPEAKDVDALFDFSEPEAAPIPENPMERIEEDQPQEAMAEAFNEPMEEEPVEALPAAEAEIEENDDDGEAAPSDKKLSEEDRQVIYALAARLRDEGTSWENIARQIAAQGYPTSSGKGTWRGVTVKNLCEKMDGDE